MRAVWPVIRIPAARELKQHGTHLRARAVPDRLRGCGRPRLVVVFGAGRPDAGRDAAQAGLASLRFEG